MGLIIGLGGLVEAVGLAPRDPLVEDVSTGSLLAGALVIYAAAGWGLAWVVARGDRALAVKRLPLVLTGGVLIVGLAAAVGELLPANTGSGPGGSDGSGRSSRRAGARGSLAAAVCDAELARAAVGGPLGEPQGLDSPFMRRSSMCSCSGEGGHVTLVVAPRERAGMWADPTAAIPLALAMDADWLVRVVAQAADGHAVDERALQTLADEALARIVSLVVAPVTRKPSARSAGQTTPAAKRRP